ncbi:MAG: C69 family dipeptidase [Erysipelotrichaceae bacterium]|nr:C69 family dipeptidase [Erysipelotrichaceae bacterium]
MACTTLLVGKKASNDGSTIIGRNDDGMFDPKKLIVIEPKDQPKVYKSKIGHLEIKLPENPLRYTATPNVDLTRGNWSACGINSENVAMTATETITSNSRVLGADPYVRYEKKQTRRGKDKAGGIGEEDLVSIILPYIRSAREGVIRLGQLLEEYGTYEPNGMAFADENEIWWAETIGGHNFIAKRVKDDEYVINPNQFGIDNFDLKDAYGAQKEHICSKGIKDLIEKYHLDCNNDGKFNPRLVFGSHSDSDHVYNTPRAWFMARYFNPTTYKWDGPNADFTPESDNIPWSLKPERKIPVEEVKYILSSYYQGTKYNPYTSVDYPEKGMYRPIAVANTSELGILQIRGYMPKEFRALEWICFGCNAFNAALPVYTNTDKMPDYLSKTTMTIRTDNFFWISELMGVITDPHFGTSIQLIERYQSAMGANSYKLINEYDEKLAKAKKKEIPALIREANSKLCDMARKTSDDALSKVVRDAGMHMKVKYNRADN